MDVFSTAQKEETLPSGWKEVSNISTMYISCIFFLLLVLTIAVSIFVVATFSLVPSMQQVMADRL